MAHDRKVTALCTLPDTSYCLSSGGDGVVKVWDVRKLPQPGGRHGSGAVKEVCLLRGNQSITSAFFSHHGTHVVATCNDNKLRVWDVAADGGGGGRGGSLVADPPSLVISHDNHTRRWISSFRTVFDPANDDTLVVGNMRRCLDLYSASAPDGLPLAQRSHELLTAIPTLNAVHPCPAVDVIVSGTASGRLYLWT